MLILLIIFVIILLYDWYRIIQYKKRLAEKVEIDSKTESYNKILSEELDQLEIEFQRSQSALKELIKQKEERTKDLQVAQELLETERDNYYKFKTISEREISNKESLSKKAFENYTELLQKQYDEAEAEYNSSLKLLTSSYEMAQTKAMKEYDDLKNKLAKDIEVDRKALEKIKQTRAAAIEAELREQRIKEELSFYCLPLSDNDRADIQVLEGIKSRLYKPRVLSMLIWSTYFQKPMTQLCNNILGTETVIGIYKITNQLSGICYIGQSVNVSERWKQHAKCGLGIDTPQHNKLYQAMLKDGIQNFSWELLEACPKEQLDEKEKYYIDLYMSKDYGYNSNIGIN